MSVDFPASTWPSTARCSVGFPLVSSATAAAPASAAARSGSGAYSASGRRRRLCARIGKPSDEEGQGLSGCSQFPLPQSHPSIWPWRWTQPCKV